MKKVLCTCFLLCSFFVEAQNLVPNGNFELYSACPSATNQINYAINWMSPSTAGTGDYHNQCATSQNVSVPSNVFGFQYALSGVAYCGICIFSLFESEYREYIEVSLSTPLTADSCYHFEMFMSLCDEYRYATDKIQVYFSGTAIVNINNWNHLPFTPQLFNFPGNFPDTLNWTMVAGDYYAQGGESFLIIGNFYNDSSTNYSLINPSGNWIGVTVFIDDVSLIQIPSCITEINEQEANNSIKLSPNPATTEIVVQSAEFNIERLEMYSVVGEMVLTHPQPPLSNAMANAQRGLRVDVSALPSGIYFVAVTDEAGNRVVRKVVKM